MWPFKRKQPTPINKIGDVLLPEPTDPDWHEDESTLNYGGTPIKHWSLLVGNVRVFRANERVPQGYSSPRVYVAGHALDNNNSELRAALDRYVAATWNTYYTRQAARPSVARMKAGCPKVGNNIEIAGWPVGAGIAALTVDEAKKFVAELEDAMALAALDPEARDAARRLGAKGGA